MGLIEREILGLFYVLILNLKSVKRNLNEIGSKMKKKYRGKTWKKDMFRSASSSRNRSGKKKKNEKVSNSINLLYPASTSAQLLATW